MKRIVICCLGLPALVCFLRAADTPPKDRQQSDAKEVTVKHVKPKEAEKLVAEHKVTVLDIRTPDEFAEGHIAGATNVNYLSSSFARQISSLPKTNAYLVHCASGNRSTKSLKIFSQQHFDSIYHLDGGFEAWKEAGLPVAK